MSIRMTRCFPACRHSCSLWWFVTTKETGFCLFHTGLGDFLRGFSRFMASLLIVAHRWLWQRKGGHKRLLDRELLEHCRSVDTAFSAAFSLEFKGEEIDRLQQTEEKPHRVRLFSSEPSHFLILLPSSAAVSLTLKGYPRIIPPFIRQKTYRKDEIADLLVKCWLSFFSLQFSW